MIRGWSRPEDSRSDRSHRSSGLWSGSRCRLVKSTVSKEREGDALHWKTDEMHCDPLQSDRGVVWHDTSPIAASTFTGGAK
jgi:hypothetical protein